MVGKTILIVDEKPASRTFLAKYLRAKQFEILEASTGKEALILAWRHEPALADIPDKEFIQKLRNDACTFSVRLVALSSDPSPARRETCLSVGVDEYLVKSSQAIPALERILINSFKTEVPVENAPRAAEKNGLLIVFVSAKGGDIITLRQSADEHPTKATRCTRSSGRPSSADWLHWFHCRERWNMGGNFALANNLNQPITLKYPTDTASIILKEAAEEIVDLARRMR